MRANNLSEIITSRKHTTTTDVASEEQVVPINAKPTTEFFHER